LLLLLQLTKRGGGDAGNVTVIIPQDQSTLSWINTSDYPTKINSTDTSFKYVLKTNPAQWTVTLALFDQDDQPIENSNHSFEGTERTYKVTSLNLVNVTSVRLFVNASK